MKGLVVEAGGHRRFGAGEDVRAEEAVWGPVCWVVAPHPIGVTMLAREAERVDGIVHALLGQLNAMFAQEILNARRAGPVKAGVNNISRHVGGDDEGSVVGFNLA